MGKMRSILLSPFICFLTIWTSYAQIETLSFDEVDDHLVAGGDTVHVVNFWATWCKPCVAELPYLEALPASVDVPVKVTLVSLDFKHQVESKLIPFMREHNLKSRVLHLYERNPNDWIDQVDPSWSGAIPATLFLHEDKRRFHEGNFDAQTELDNIIFTLYNSKS